MAQLENGQKFECKINPYSAIKSEGSKGLAPGELVSEAYTNRIVSSRKRPIKCVKR